MTAKEKAIELREKFTIRDEYAPGKSYVIKYGNNDALICADQVIEWCDNTLFKQFWMDVKNELQKL